MEALIRLARPEDKNEIVDFADLVFSQLQIPHHFPDLLPKVYGDHRNLSIPHMVYTEDGKIMGCLGLFPIDLTFGKQHLKVGYLGTMSVHRRCRGKGVMKQLVHRMKDYAQQEGYDMLVLGGQRQRYEYYGFDAVGGRWSYTLSPANVRHSLPVEPSNITFQEILPQSEDAAIAHALHETKRPHVIRSLEYFVDICHSFKAKPYLVSRGEEIIGYIVASLDNATWKEFVFPDSTHLLPAIKAWWMTQGISALTLLPSPWDKASNKLLAPIADGVKHSPCEMLCCLNPRRVLEVLLPFAYQWQPMVDGTLSLSVESCGSPFRICIHDGKASFSDCPKKEATHLSLRDFHKVVFGINPFDKPAVEVPAAWFPIPFAIDPPDTF